MYQPLGPNNAAAPLAVQSDTPAAIKYRGRTKTDFATGLIFAGAVIAHVVMLAYVAAKGGSYQRIFDSWCSCQVEIQALTPDQCDIEAADMTGFAKDGILALLRKYPGVLAFAVGMTGLLSVTWVWLLQKFARFVCWATMFIKVAVVVYIGIWMIQQGFSTQGFVFFAIAAALCLALYRYRNKVELAAEILRTAAKALDQNMSMFLAAAVIQIMMLFYLVLFALAIIAVPGVGKWTADQATGMHKICLWEPESWVKNGRWFAVVMFYWTMGFFAMTRLYTLSAATGLWFFHQYDQSEDKPKRYGFAGLRWALSTGAGTVSFGAIIVGIAQWIKDRAKSPRTPWGCVAYVLVSLVANLIMFISRFALIMSAFYNVNFGAGGRISMGLLSKHFAGGFVSTSVSKNVLALGAYIFSMLVGFTSYGAVMVWEDKPLFDGIKTWGYLFYGLYILGHFYPTFMLFIVAILVAPIGDLMGWAWVYGAFCGLISHILFKYMACVFLDTSDAIFACLAIDRENGMTSPISNEIVTALKNQNCPEFLEWQVGPEVNSTVVAMPGAAYAAPVPVAYVAPVSAPGQPLLYAQQQQAYVVPQQPNYQAIQPQAGQPQQQQRGMYPNF